MLWKIAEIIHEADLDDERYNAPEAPRLDIALRKRRARAVALDNGLTPQKTFRTYNSEVVFHEIGRLVLVAGGPVEVLNVPSHMSASDTTKTIIEPVVVGHVDFMVRLAAAVDEDYGYLGAWRIAVIIGDGLDGAQSWILTKAQHFAAGGTYTGEDDYTQTAAATLEDLTQHPEQVVKKLISPLLRSLQSQRRFPWLMPD